MVILILRAGLEALKIRGRRRTPTFIFVLQFIQCHKAKNINFVHGQTYFIYLSKSISTRAGAAVNYHHEWDRRQPPKLETHLSCTPQTEQNFCSSNCMNLYHEFLEKQKRHLGFTNKA